MQILMNKLSVLIPLFCLLATAILAQTYTLEQTVVAGGGMSAGTGGSYALDSTTGQTAAGGALRGSPFAMTVGFWNYEPLSPTAAGVSISGRVTTSDGRGIRNARLILVNSSGERSVARTGPFGYFRFEDVSVGEIYVLTIYSKRFIFAEPSRIITLNEDLTDVNFVGDSE